ncbi:MAG: glutathione S-transferase [Phyllobacterium sp.]
MLKVWGRKNSTNVKKALWCAEELNLHYEHIPAGGAFGVVDDPTFRKLNPNGLVPVIEDDGLVLWESNAIVRYLGSKYGDGEFYAADPAKRARADRWMDWTTSRVATPFRDIFWNMVRTPEEQRDMAAIEKGIQACGALFAIADAALSEEDYLSGPKLGMGDIPLGCFIYAWFEMPIERPHLPGLARWYARLKERPAYQQAVMTELT